jgi:hypothetical protein
LNKEGALVSKALRTLGLRLLPGDLVDEAMAVVDATAQDSTAKDPSLARRQMVDAFASIGVQPDDLVGWLGHALDKTTPAEIVELRKMHTSIRDGEARWSDYVDAEKPKGEASASEALKAKLTRKENEA